MFIDFSDKNKKTLWTHSSLLAADRFDGVKKIEDGRQGFKTKFNFFSTYLSLEAVNRIPALKKLPFYYRAGIVAGVFIGSRYLSVAIYNSSNQTEKKRLLDGAPVWENKYDVPELDKKFFFIDDDNKFEPSLWHHGITSIDKPKRFYRYESDQ